MAMLMNLNTGFEIRDKNGSIELCANIPQPTEVVKKQLIDQQQFWYDVQSQFIKDFAETSYEFENLMDWVTKLDSFLMLNDMFPSIENIAVLHQMRSLNSYAIKPQVETSKNNLSVSDSNFNCELQIDGNLVFGKPKKQGKLKERVISPHEYKLVRIVSDNEQGRVQTDLKIRGLKTKEFIESFLTLPEFWRNFHLITRKTIGERDEDPMNGFNQIFHCFYNPNPVFLIKEKPVFKKEQLITNISVNQEMPINTGSLATQLMFRHPGLVLPLTKEEEIVVRYKKPDILIELSKHNVINENAQTSVVSIHVPEPSFTTFFSNFSDSFMKREYQFSEHFNINNYSGGQYFVFKKSNVVFNYERNMVAIFESLTQIDHKNEN